MILVVGKTMPYISQSGGPAGLAVNVNTGELLVTVASKNVILKIDETGDQILFEDS